MSVLQEAEAKNKLISTFMDDVVRLNSEILSGSLVAVGDLWETLESHFGPLATDNQAIEFKELAQKIGLRPAATLTAARDFLEDAYDNFGKAEIGFPPSSMRTAQEMCKSLAEFIDAGLKPNSQDRNGLDPLEGYGRTLQLYETLIKETDQMAMTSDGIGWVKL